MAPPPHSLLLCAGFLLALCLPPAAVEGEQEAPKRNFDLPAGMAGETLKDFAAQAGCEIIFQPSAVAGVKTNAVHGNFTREEALDQLLAGTGLIGSRDEKTGVLAVFRAGPGKTENNRSSADTENTEAKKKT